MKKSWLTLIVFLLVGTFFAPQTASASQEVDVKSSRKELVKKVAKHSKSIQKEAKLFKGQAAETPIDLESEPDRWMWFWIFSWGIAAFLSIFLWELFFLPGLFWLAGTVFLIIWLVRKFS